jgi:hypothetical protein
MSAWSWFRRGLLCTSTMFTCLLVLVSRCLPFTALIDTLSHVYSKCLALLHICSISSHPGKRLQNEKDAQSMNGPSEQCETLLNFRYWSHFSGSRVSLRWAVLAFDWRTTASRHQNLRTWRIQPSRRRMGYHPGYIEWCTRRHNDYKYAFIPQNYLVCTYLGSNLDQDTLTHFTDRQLSNRYYPLCIHLYHLRNRAMLSQENLLNCLGSTR